MSNRLGIDNLKFFTANGYQIQMQKRYSVSWEIVPADCVYNAFVRNPKGHFELEPEVDLTNAFNDEHAIVADGFTTTQPIEIAADTTYTITVSGFINENAVVLFDNNSGVIHSFNAPNLKDDTTIKFASANYPSAKYFTVKSINTDRCRILSQYNIATIVIDDSGIIKPSVNFYRKSCDVDYIRQTNGVYKEISGYDMEYTIDKAYDIIFFAYKYGIYKKDGTLDETIIQNKIRITLLTDDGVIEEDYDLLDFFSSSVDIASLSFMERISSWDGNSDFLAEDGEETYMYGLSNHIIKQRFLKESAFDEDKDDEVYKHWSTAFYLIKMNVDDRQYPYVKYIGNVTQDKTSTNFISTSTIIVVDDVNGDGTQYEYPVFEDADSHKKYRLHFTFQKDSEMKFVISDDNVNVKKLDSFYTLLPTEKSESTNAITFTVGCESDTEGCYQNTMGMFLRDDEFEVDYFIGVIIFKTEIEDEDERYRTLMTNFGIPDPINYPNIFKTQDVDEQATDWRLVNEKSKELFINYDNIFPYVGTYKALFNAIKYLGYQDIIFKEWYKILDNNDNTKFVAIQTHNTSDGSYIENNLKNYGVEYGEYERYTKLNRLSMVYHMQTIKDDESEQQLHTIQNVYKYNIGNGKVWFGTLNYAMPILTNTDDRSVFDVSWDNVIVQVVDINGKFYMKVVSGTFVNPSKPSDTIVVGSTSNNTYYISKAATNSSAHVSAVTTVFSSAMSVNGTVKEEAVSAYYNASDIPAIENVYEYRTDEVLAKLYSVKKWLEKYITGVNCYISDINGEGIVLERLKTIGYVTQHEYKDITSEGKFTPKCYQKTDNTFTDSSAIITCSLNEFNSLSFEDYDDYPIDRFIKNEYMTTITNEKGESETLNVYDSCPLCAMTVADEYQFDLHLDYSTRGSLYEFVDKTTLDNPIVINDGEITFFDLEKIESRIDSKELPIIEIHKGNIRRVEGFWYDNEISESNIFCTIHSSTDADGNVFYVLTDENTKVKVRCKGCVQLSPYVGGDSIAKYANVWQNYVSVVGQTTENPEYERVYLDAEGRIVYSVSVDGEVYKADITDEMLPYGNTAVDLFGSIAYLEAYYAYHREYPRMDAAEKTVDSNGASFIYTTNNKWKQPLFVIKGYSVANQMKSDLYSYTEHNGYNNNAQLMFDNRDEYILEIIEGSIKFRTHSDNSEEKYCKEARVDFSQPNTEDVNVEQQIHVSYKYSSDRTPIYEYDNSGVSGCKTFKDVLDYMDEHTKLNTEIDIPVNRLGDYTVSVKAYDSYNNVYTNSNNDVCSVSVRKPDINIYLNSDYSNNETDFYKSNIDGTKLDDGEKALIMNNVSLNKNPKYPINYRIYSAEHDVEGNIISYDNISYALDTPKANDYMIINNLTERVYNMTYTSGSSSDTIHIDMMSNNPFKQNIYVKGGKVNICVYDDNLHKIVTKTDTPISMSNVVNATNDGHVRIGADGSFDLILDDTYKHDNMDFITKLKSLLDDINKLDNNINAYVINASSINIDFDADIINDYVNKTAFIPINIHTDDHNKHTADDSYSDDSKLQNFPKDTMVKITAYIVNDGVETVVNEAAYRVLDTSVVTFENDLEPEATSVKCGYVINGNIDSNFLNNLYNNNVYKKVDEFYDGETKTYKYSADDIKFRMQPLHTNAVQYVMRVVNDAKENIFTYGNRGFYAMNTTVEYNSRQLMFDEYFDDSYAAEIVHYDANELENIWDYECYDNMSDADIYRFTNHPITVDANRILIIKTDDTIPQFEDGFKTKWSWYAYVIEDNTNWNDRKHNIQKTLLFESVNDTLCVKPQKKASQSIELECMDKYGNIIVNDGGGNVYVK